MNMVDTTPLLTRMAVFPVPPLLLIQALVPPNIIQLGLQIAKYQCQQKRLRISFLTLRRNLGFSGIPCAIWWVELLLYERQTFIRLSSV